MDGFPEEYDKSWINKEGFLLRDRIINHVKVDIIYYLNKRR